MTCVFSVQVTHIDMNHIHFYKEVQMDIISYTLNYMFSNDL